MKETQNTNHSLTVYHRGQQRELSFEGQPLLLDLLRENGISVSAPCSGDGRCGQCRVEIRGQVSPPKEDELAFAGTGFSCGEGFVTRLACRTRLLGSAEVKLTDEATGHKVSAGLPAAFSSTQPFAVAVDIGTTTIGMRAVDMHTGRALAQRSELNDQRVCGADVISRIAYCSREGGVKTLSDLIRCQLTRMILLMSGGRQPEFIAAAGNTVMLHLLAGLDPTYLGQAPYRTREHFGTWYRGEQLSLPADCWLAPCMGGYTGGDLTAALLALTSPQKCGAPLTDGLALCDLGTNGEMAIFFGGRWLTASSAAGPALEGGGISCGSGAVKGAVTTLSHGDNQTPYRLTSAQDSDVLPVRLEVLGDCEPASLTGSALVSLTALLLREGKIYPTGRMEADSWKLTDRVEYTQADTRLLQLAKGAVAAAFYRLCEEYIDYQKPNINNDCLHIDLRITGGLGCRMVTEDADAIGLTPFPEGCRGDIHFEAQLALEGAELCLREEERRRAVQLASEAQVLELTGDDRFDRLFVSCMRLGEPDMDF